MKKLFFVFLLLASCKQSTSTEQNITTNPIVLPATFTGFADAYRNGKHFAQDTVKIVVTRLDSVLVLTQTGWITDYQNVRAWRVNPPKNTIFKDGSHPDDSIFFNDEKTIITEITRPGITVIGSISDTSYSVLVAHR